MTGFFSSLRFRLLLLVLLALIPALGLIFYTASEQRQRAATEVQANALRLTRLVAAEQDSHIEGARTLLITLARLPEVRGGDTAACTALFADLLKQYPYYANLGAAKLDGNLFCSGLPLTRTLNITDRSFFQHTVQTCDFCVGEYQIDRITGKAAISFGYPIIDENGRVGGIVFVGLDLAWLNKFMIEARLPLGTTLRVIDQNGTILARYPDPEQWIGRPMPEATIVQTILSQGEGVTDGLGVDGVPRLFAFAALRASPGANVYVSIGIPKVIAFAEADWILARNLIALGLVAVLTLVAAWIGADLFVLHRVNALLDVTKRLAAGDLTARTGLRYSVGELGQLARSFDQMVEALEQREVERKQSEQVLRRHDARAEALARIAHRLNAQLDLQRVMNTVCEETIAALDVPAASIDLLDKNSDALCYAMGVGLPPEYGQQARPIPRSFYEEDIRRMGPVIVIPDGRACSDLPNVDLFATVDIRTIMSTSMLREGQLVGCLNVLTFGQTRCFNEDEMSLLKVLADEAAQAITNARLYNALSREERAHADLLHKVIAAQEDERKRIARELHDETIQDLTLLMMDLDLGRIAQAVDIRTADNHLQRCKVIAEEMLANLRRLTADLRPSLLDDLGLVPAIAWYGEQRLKPLGIALQLRGNALERRLPQVMETALFRIAQEALTNIAKHSSASRVIVNLQMLDSHIVLTVKDNGKGFRSPGIGMVDANGSGLGLPGIKERVSILGGEFQLQTAPGQGTMITVRIPLDEEGARV